MHTGKRGSMRLCQYFSKVGSRGDNIWAESQQVEYILVTEMVIGDWKGRV